MKIKKTDGRVSEPKRDYSNNSRPLTGITDPLPMEEPEKTQYSMRSREVQGTVGRAGFKGAKRSDGRLKENRRKKSLKNSPTHNATATQVWLRNDIYAAVNMFKKEHKRSLRSIVEEALYNFLIKEGRVKAVEDMGEDVNTASWVKP